MFGQILAKRVVTLEFSRMMGQARQDSTSNRSREDVLKHTVIRNDQTIYIYQTHQSVLMSKHPKYHKVSKFYVKLWLLQWRRG